MGGVTLLEMFNDTQGVDIVIEAAAVALKAAVQRALTGVSEGRMADVVNQRQRLGQIFVQAECGRDSPGDLRDLNRVSQAAAKMVGGTAGKNLRLSRQPPEGAGLHNPFAVTLERRSRSTQRRGMDAGQKEIVRVSCDRASMEIDCHSQI